MLLKKKPVQFFSVIPSSLPTPHSNTLQFYVKCEKYKVNYVIVPSGCEVRTFCLGSYYVGQLFLPSKLLKSKNVKIGIFTGLNYEIFKNISR